MDSWCGGETGEGDGLARRDDQEAGDDLGKGATFTNFLCLLHFEFSEFCLVHSIFSTDCNEKPVNLDESCVLSVQLVELLLTLIEALFF